MKKRTSLNSRYNARFIKKNQKNQTLRSSISTLKKSLFRSSSKSESISDASNANKDNESTDRMVTPKIRNYKKSHDKNNKALGSTMSEDESDYEEDFLPGKHRFQVERGTNYAYFDSASSSESDDSTITSATPTSISFLSVEEIRKQMGNRREDIDLDTLLDELSRLRIQLSDMELREIDWDEKLEMKDLSLIKLAKQFALSQEALQTRYDQLQQSINLQAKLASRISMLRYELDSVSNKRSISHESQDDTKKIIDEMNEHHVKQYEALHRKLIAANNETNQLKKKLLKYEKADPIQVGTTNNSSITNQTMEVKRKEIFHSIIRVISLLILAAILLILAFIATFKTRIPPIIMSSLCSPTPPGTILSTPLPPSLSLKAPWWVPPVAKPMTYGAFCAFENVENKIRPRTQIEWRGNKDKKLLVVSRLPTKGFSNKKVSNEVLLKRAATSVIIRADKIEVFTGDKPGASIILDAPWNLDK